MKRILAEEEVATNWNRHPPLNYTVMVNATSGAIQHTAQVSVTVP